LVRIGLTAPSADRVVVDVEPPSWPPVLEDPRRSAARPALESRGSLFFFSAAPSEEVRL